MISGFRFLLVIVGLGQVFLSSSAAAELYRYTNEDGVTVLDSHVPARYVKNGYTIMSLDGRVLEVVPRALTDEEIRERDRRMAQEEEANRIQREREIADQNLMRLYGNSSDVLRARDAKISSIDSLIETQRGNIQRLESQKQQLEASLADIERSGGVISKDSQARVRSIESRISQVESEIENKLQEREELIVSYAKDLERVKELYGR